MVVASTGLYFWLSLLPGGESVTGLKRFVGMERLWESLYFSIITSTTVGYGDVIPQGYSKVVVCLQATLSVFLAAIVVAKLVSHRQEVTLERVHKLTFENAFNNVRSGFYIVRKDFDSIIHELDSGRGMSHKHWENMTMACRQIENLIEDIPEFYGDDPHLYTIDNKREMLLLDAVIRTTRRLEHVVELMRDKKVEWTENTDAETEVRKVLENLEELLPIWEARSPYDDKKEFGELVEAMKEIRRRM